MTICKNPGCQTEIPPNQHICPACYGTAGDFADKQPRNVMWFLSNAAVNGLYSGRTQKYLQPGRVGWNFYADTGEALEEITRNPDGTWHLLITDTDRVANATASLNRFRAIHPACVVAILGNRAESGGLSGSLVFLNDPSEIDPWLAMMYALLRQA